jgi:hypothetical protein
MFNNFSNTGNANVTSWNLFIMLLICNSDIWNAEVGEARGQDPSWLHREFGNNLSYNRLCLIITDRKPNWNQSLHWVSITTVKISSSKKAALSQKARGNEPIDSVDGCELGQAPAQNITEVNTKSNKRRNHHRSQMNHFWADPWRKWSQHIILIPAYLCWLGHYL